MAQIKIYGIKERLAPVRERLSEVIHECVMEALQLVEETNVHLLAKLPNREIHPTAVSRRRFQ